ncbi:MAG TPA: glycoside hydrolase family 2 TIM barrel-domain containing protein [Opitutales bacterium]|nr:glycoside hydrolase family 2 TIM barrel-domain containing protein [Opitutales bacterium]
MKKSLCAFVLFMPLALSAEVKVLNTSFEEYDNGKPVGWTLGGKFGISKGAGHNGSGGLFWESDKPCGKLHVATQRIQGVKKGDIIEFSALARKEGFKTASSQGAVFSVEMRDSNDKWIRALYATMKRDQPDGEWTLIRSSGLVPDNAESAVIQIYVSGDSEGRVSWDNLVVRKVETKPVSFLCTSAYRNLAVDGKVDLHAATKIPDGTVGKPSGFFTWRDSDGNDVCTPAEVLSDGEASITLDVSKLAMGEQVITFDLKADGKTLGSASTDFTRVSELPDRHVWIDGHGRCIVDGSPFFPLGMYWNPGKSNMADFTNGPFNCVVHYEMLAPHRLDFCREAGLKSFSAIDHKLWKAANDASLPPEEMRAAREKLARAVNAIKNHPALLGWYVGDELEVTAVPSQCDLYGFLKKLDAGHPVYAVQDRTYDLREFTPTTDVIGLDPYPVCQKPVRMVTDFMRKGRKAMFDSRPHWSVPQAFSWQWYRANTQDIERFPTLAEMRSMNWQHIANGANGLLSFAFNCYFYPLNKQDWRTLWALTVEANREVAKMIPVLLSIEPAPLGEPASADLVCRTWVKDGDLYLLACNLSEKPLYTSVKLSDGAWKMSGAEVGTPAAMAGPSTVRFYLDPIGVSFVRLSKAD